MARAKKVVEALDKAEPLRIEGSLIEARQLMLPGRVTKVSLELPANLLFEEWARIGGKLHEVSASTMWWIGDWLLYGPATYGEMYQGPAKESGFSYSTLSKAKMVAEHFEFCRRRQNLSWEHHKILVPIKDDGLAERLLSLAETGKDGKKWTIGTMRAVVGAIREGATLEEALDTVLAITGDQDDSDFLGDDDGARTLAKVTPEQFEAGVAALRDAGKLTTNTMAELMKDALAASDQRGLAPGRLGSTLWPAVRVSLLH